MRKQMTHAVKLAVRRSPLGPILVHMLRGMRGNAALSRGRRNPARWHEFEVAHPDAFGSLYEI